MRNKRFPNYPDDTDYTTNAPSYYDDLARKQKLIQLLAEKIWEYDDEIKDYFKRWEDNLDTINSDVIEKMIQWLEDGTLEQLINDDVLGNKADKSFVDSEIERLDNKDVTLTTQFEQTNLNKVDKNGSGQVVWANIAQDARQQIIGNIPPAVVGTDAVITTNITNNAVTTNKRTTSGSGAFINTLGVPFNVDTVLNKISFPTNTYINYQNKTMLVSSTAFEIPLANGALLYNTDTNTLKCALPTNGAENELILGTTYKTGLSFNGYYTVDGIPQKITGYNFYGYIISVQGDININTTTRTLTLGAGNKYIMYGNKFITLDIEEINYTYTNGFLWYDLKSQSFGSGTTLGHDSLIMLGYLNPSDMFINGNFTVNGKQNIKANTITKEMLDFDPLTEIPTLTVDSKWKGKKAVTFGDSITWYDGQPFGSAHKESGTIANGYQSYMRDQLQCTVDNKGASGQDLLSITNIVKSYDFSDTDFATLTSGANDERKGVAVGTMQAVGSVHNDTTFIGALQSAIEYMITSNKNMKIYLMTPIRGWYNTYNTPDVPNADPNVVGMMSENYANAIKEVGQLYGLPVLDWYNLTGLNELTKNDYLGDITSLPYYLHPTNAFYERMASNLIPFLNNY